LQWRVIRGVIKHPGNALPSSEYPIPFDKVNEQDSQRILLVISRQGLINKRVHKVTLQPAGSALRGSLLELSPLVPSEVIDC